MTVGDLRAELAKLDSQQNVVVSFDGAFVPMTEVAVFEGLDFVLVRGKGKTSHRKKFTIEEQGLIGHLVRLGFDNDKIGNVLERPSKSVKDMRKKLDF